MGPAWHSRRPHQPHCGTGIWPDRDIAAGWRDIQTLCASPRTRSPSQPRTAARKAEVLDLRKRMRERHRLSAGGRWIRTLGPRKNPRSAAQACIVHPGALNELKLASDTGIMQAVSRSALMASRAGIGLRLGPWSLGRTRRVLSQQFSGRVQQTAFREAWTTPVAVLAYLASWTRIAHVTPQAIGLEPVASTRYGSAR